MSIFPLHSVLFFLFVFALSFFNLQNFSQCVLKSVTLQGTYRDLQVDHVIWNIKYLWLGININFWQRDYDFTLPIMVIIFIYFFVFCLFKIFLNFSSVTIVCIFSPSLHPTPVNPTSLLHLYPPPWFCPCVLYSGSCNYF